MNQNMKRLMKELGEAINLSVSDSEQIAEVINGIKAEGYDVFLVLEATIGLNKRDDATGHDDGDTDIEPEFRIDSQDVNFLRSLRISVDDKDRGRAA